MNRKKSKKTMRVAVIAVIIASIAIIVAFLISHFMRNDETISDNPTESTGSTEETQSTDETTTTEEETTKSNITSKGYTIETIDGVTYINGVLIVNKEYSLPRSYDLGDLTDETVAAFEEMRRAALSDGIRLWNQSGYRSYDRQEELYNQSLNSEESDVTDSYIAKPGYSEHQSGLSLDVNSVTEAMGEWSEGIWLRDNCYKYGFIIRYPEGKEEYTGYSYEPWHIRYVGKELALTLHDSGECLEEYLGITSEYAH